MVGTFRITPLKDQARSAGITPISTNHFQSFVNFQSSAVGTLMAHGLHYKKVMHCIAQFKITMIKEEVES